MEVFILAGQSNMSGRADLKDSKISSIINESHSNNDGKTMINEKEILKFNELSEWVPAKDPLHFDKPSKNGVGPALSFAIELTKLNIKNNKIGLIPCAVGGTSIKQWQPNQPNGNEEEKYFDISMNRINNALEKITSQLNIPSNEISLSGILWHQGEADSNDIDTANEYNSYLITIMTQFRNDLNNNNIPVLVGKLGLFLDPKVRNDNDFQYYNIINEQINNLPSELDKCVSIDSDGLDDKGDFVHFDTKSQEKFGPRYAKKYQELLGLETVIEDDDDEKPEKKCCFIL